MARRLEASGIGVLMTRWQDKFLELEGRPTEAIVDGILSYVR